jgi:hypothetical protein
MTKEEAKQILLRENWCPVHDEAFTLRSTGKLSCLKCEKDEGDQRACDLAYARLVVFGPEPVDPFKEWAKSRPGWWTVADAFEGLRDTFARSTVYRKMDTLWGSGELESKWENDGKRYFRWKA